MNFKTIPTAEIIVGIRMLYQNVNSFIEEVNIMNNQTFRPHSYSFCQLAYEELAKIVLLFDMWLDRINNVDINYDSLNDKYFCHKEKTKELISFSINFYNIMKENNHNDLYDKLIAQENKYFLEPGKLTNKKDDALYVNIDNNRFYSPDDRVTKKDFDKLYLRLLLINIAFGNIIPKMGKNIDFIASERKKRID